MVTIGPLRFQVEAMTGNRVSLVIATDERVLIEADGGEVMSEAAGGEHQES